MASSRLGLWCGVLALALVLAACETQESGGGGGGGSGGSQTPDPLNAQQQVSCTMGQTYTCGCGPGTMGTQVCQGGQLSECRCGSSDPQNQRFGCDPAVPLRMPCQCDDGRPGVKRCGSDGVLQDCDCDDLGAAGAPADSDRDAG